MTENSITTLEPNEKVVPIQPICVICESPMPLVNNGTYSFDKGLHSLRIAMFQKMSNDKEVKVNICFPCVQVIIANAKLELK